MTICGFAELATNRDKPLSHLLSILDPAAACPPELAAYAANQRLELRFHDVIDEAPGVVAPSCDDLRRLLAFARSALVGPAAHLLLHCHAGFSRSPAAGLLIIALAQPERASAQLVAELRQLRPQAWPNLRMVEIGDGILGRRGSIVEAVLGLYRDRLAQEPGLREMLIRNGRAREVAAAGLL